MLSGLAGIARAIETTRRSRDSRPNVTALMQAIVYSHGASGEVLRLEEVEKPLPADDEVLIRVRAASINPLDYHFLKHTFMRRIMARLSKVKILRPGRDVAGEVEAVGRNVTRFKAGDAVF